MTGTEFPREDGWVAELRGRFSDVVTRSQQRP
jgi:hypothetical protein